MSGPYMPLDSPPNVRRLGGGWWPALNSSHAQDPKNDRKRLCDEKVDQPVGVPLPDKMNWSNACGWPKRRDSMGSELNYDLDNDLSPKSGAKDYAEIRKLADKIGIQISGLCSSCSGRTL